MKTSKILLLSVSALSLSISGAAWGQSAEKADAAKVEKTTDKKAKEKKKKDQIFITGTRIARDNYNTSSPVVILQAVEFERMGATSIFELLSLLPEIGAENVIDSAPYRSNPNESLGNQERGRLRGGMSALGADTVSLRNFSSYGRFSSGSTLILVNGRRIAPHSLASGQGTNTQVYTNLDNIPVEAVARIEILKDGASTIYGSDAIAGVINIILKKGYNDVHSVTGTIKMATKGDNAQYRLAYSHGFSDIGGGDNSLFLSGEYVRQNSLLANAREPGREVIQSPGGTLRSRGAWVYDPVTGWSRPTMHRPYYLVNPSAAHCDREGTDDAGNPAECFQDIGTLTDLTPAFHKFGMTATYDQSLANGVDLFATATFSYNRQRNRSAPENVSLSGLPGTASGEVLLVQLTDVGNRTRTVEGVAYSFVGGFKGKFAPMGKNMNWEISGRYSGNQTDSQYHNYVLQKEYDKVRPSTSSDVFRASLPTTHPFYQALPTGELLLGQPGATPQAIIDQIRAPDFTRRGLSSTYGFDAHIAGDLFDGPAGPVSFALGGTYTGNTLSDRPASFVDLGIDFSAAVTTIINAPIGNAYDASRSNGAIFGEILFPVLKDTLTVDVSGRMDIDDLFGAHFSPKVGFRFEPIAQLMFRGNYNQGFRAPSIVEFGRPTSVDNTASIAIDANKPGRAGVVCADPGAVYSPTFYVCNVVNTTLDNPNIKPETSEQYSFGAVVKPLDNVEFAADWYRIERTDEIRFLNGGESFDTHPETIGYNAAGELATTQSFYGNFGNMSNEGIDFSLRVRLDLGKYGEITNNVKLIHRLSVTQEGRALGAGTIEQKAGFGNQPKWTGTNSLNWVGGDWNTTVTYRYSGTYDNAFSASRRSRQPCNTTTTKYNCMVPAFGSFDWNVGYRGIKNVSLTLNVRNLFDSVAERDISVVNPVNYGGIGREASFRANVRF